MPHVADLVTAVNAAENIFSKPNRKLTRGSLRQNCVVVVQL